jgi:hypothetical protein
MFSPHSMVNVSSFNTTGRIIGEGKITKNKFDHGYQKHLQVAAMQFSCQDAFANVYAEIFTRVIHQNNVAVAQFSKQDMLYGERKKKYIIKI